MKGLLRCPMNLTTTLLIVFWLLYSVNAMLEHVSSTHRQPATADCRDDDADVARLNFINWRFWHGHDN